MTASGKSTSEPLSRRRLMLSAAGLLASGALARAGQDVTFSTEVKVVNVLANVYGKNGEIVRSLTKEDFLLAEDGRPQTIRYFSRETDLPLTLGLMVDTSMSQRRVLDAERVASFDFVDQVLREATDHVFIVRGGNPPAAHLVAARAGKRPWPGCRALHAAVGAAAWRRHTAV
jgi:hypothetical protein